MGGHVSKEGYLREKNSQPSPKPKIGIMLAGDVCRSDPEQNRSFRAKKVVWGGDF